MNILILKPSSLGDIINGLQVAQSIKEQLPGCHIDWVVRDRFAPIVSQCNVIDTIFLFNRRKGLRSFIRLLKEIRKKEYDYVLDFQGLARTGVMTYFARGKYKLGRSDARELSFFAYDKRVPLPASGKMSHAVDILLQFLPEMGLKGELLGTLRFNSHSLEAIDVRLKGSVSPIVMIPNSRQARKEWGGFVELARKILEHYGDQLVVWDSHMANNTLGLEAYEHFINVSGKTSIEDMISLVAGARLVIANDSGPMHLAAAMGRPILGLFGPTASHRFGPYPLSRGSNHVLEAPGGDLGELSVESVFQAVKKILN